MKIWRIGVVGVMERIGKLMAQACGEQLTMVEMNFS